MNPKARDIAFIVAAIVVGVGFAVALTLLAVVPAMKNTCTLFTHGCQTIKYRQLPDGQLLIENPVMGVNYWYDGSYIRSYGPKIPGKCPSTLQPGSPMPVQDGEARVQCERITPEGECVSTTGGAVVPTRIGGTPTSSFGTMLEPTFVVNAYTLAQADGGVVCSRARNHVERAFEHSPTKTIRVRGHTMSVFQILSALKRRGVFARPAEDPQPNACTGHGTQTPNGCVCKPGYTGARCATKMCTSDDSCVNGTCNAGLCECIDGWRGDACDKLKCAAACVNGACGSLGVCECVPGYEGDRCEKRRCVQDCVNGSCNSVTGGCDCDLGWTGVACENKMCPKSCSGNGICNAPDGECECIPGWTGAACDDPVCPGGCNRNGECDLVTGKCVCGLAWTGESCDTYACPNGCCTHGTCDGTTCVCRPGWGGPDCSEPDDPTTTELRCPSI